jgi:hypothetical protein
LRDSTPFVVVCRFFVRRFNGAVFCKWRTRGPSTVSLRSTFLHSTGLVTLTRGLVDVPVAATTCHCSQLMGKPDQRLP